MYKIYTRHFHLQNPRARFLLVWDNILRGGSSTIHLLLQVYCPIFLNSRSQGCKALQLGRLLYIIQIKECLIRKINLGQVVINAGWGPERYSKWPIKRETKMFSEFKGGFQACKMYTLYKIYLWYTRKYAILCNTWIKLVSYKSELQFPRISFLVFLFLQYHWSNLRILMQVEYIVIW